MSPQTKARYTCAQIKSLWHGCDHATQSSQSRVVKANCPRTCGTCPVDGATKGIYLCRQQGISFAKHPLKHCSGNTVGGTYSSLSTAKAACESNSKCTGVYDSSCDNSGSFKLCNSAALKTSSSSCVFMKSTLSTSGALSASTSSCVYTASVAGDITRVRSSPSDFARFKF